MHSAVPRYFFMPGEEKEIKDKDLMRVRSGESVKKSSQWEIYHKYLLFLDKRTPG